MKEREVGAKIKNFTPLMDELVKEFDLITAAVWGRVWRYAQQENGVCQASHETIAQELNISVRSVIRKLQDLAGAGYLNDRTPGLKNRPHTYAITKKARIMITIEGVTESHTEQMFGVTESHSTVTESHSHRDTESREETKKKQIKKQDDCAFPDGLNTPAFVYVWKQWIEYREERKKKLTPSTAAAQLKKLDKLGPLAAAATIEQSIEQGWIGLFPLKDQPEGNGKPQHITVDPSKGFAQ